MVEHRHLPHVASFRDNPIVFFTTCTHKRRKLLACAQSHAILRGLWKRSAERDGWWVGHYILMPDHVHFFARRGTVARPMAELDEDVEERQLPPTRGCLEHCATCLATRLFRSLSSLARKLWAKMELRGAKCVASRIDQRRRGMAIQRFDL
jgi:hypothetical protein